MHLELDSFPPGLQNRNLEKLQNRAIRIITDSPYDAPAKPILRQLRLPSISEMIRQESAGMVYKAINGQAPAYLSSRFKEYLQ